MANYINKILVYDAGKNRKIGAADNLEIGGGFTAANVNGDGAGLTNLQSAALTGALPALNAASLTDLNASAINAGTVEKTYLPNAVAYKDDPFVAFLGDLSAVAFIGDGGSLTNLSAGNLVGALPALDGSALTSISAANIVGAGQLPDEVLSANVPLYNAGSNVFIGSIQASAFLGNGADITDIAAGNITSGTLADSILSSNVAKYDDAAPTFINQVSAPSYLGSGEYLTSLVASAITSGELSDDRLSANILRKDAASNTLTGNLSVGGNLNVTGNIVSGGVVNVVLSDQFLDLNGNNLLGTPVAGGLAVNVESFGTIFDIESFTAGGTGTDPYCVVSGDASGLAAGLLVQISQSASSNDGQFIVYSASYNGGTGKTTVTLRGNAASAHPASAYPQLPFVHNQFTTATETAKLVSITVGALAVSNGALYGPGHVAIDSGDWCFASGSDVTAFTDQWVSIRPSSAPSLQTAYNASSSPVQIKMTAAQGGFTLMPDTGETAGFSFSASDDSEIDATGHRFDIRAAHLRLLSTQTEFQGAGGVSLTCTGLDEGTVVYVDSTGVAVASDAASLTDAALEVDGVATLDTMYAATVPGTKVRVAYAGSAPAVGEVVYLGGGANAGKCVSALPTTGRVTKLGKCVVAGSAGICTIVWSPDYIADL